jgi:hypothetical protein
MTPLDAAKVLVAKALEDEVLVIKNLANSDFGIE